MRLAPRLVLAFGFVAVLSTTGLGVLVREDRVNAETTRFDAEVQRACDSVRAEVVRQAERDRRLVGGACQSGELVDRALVALEHGDFAERRLAFSSLVPAERVAFDFDELLLAVDDGDLVGADPKSLLSQSRRDVAAAMGKGPASYSFRRGDHALSLVSRCAKAGRGHVAGLVGARHLEPLLARQGAALGVTVAVGRAVPAADVTVASCGLADERGAEIPLTVSKPRAELTLALASIDQRILLAAAVSLGVALVFAVLLARSLGRPLAELAREASRVKTDEARPLTVRGSGEVRDLVVAFDKMIEDLAVTRRRLAATTRVAAWREVARRVAHEVKNPLAPIRAAVETLRRLRARDDPAFDEYFDEATRTVLSEVHRISTIVTEFTRFARLPQPRPEDLDPVEVARKVVSSHEPLAESTVLELVEPVAPKAAASPRRPRTLRADRDQLVQVLTNLVQNALDAVRGRPDARVTLSVVWEPDGRCSLTVEDNGPGLAKEIAPRLFEPYATTKAQGTGLGLAIAQRIAIEHDGELAYIGRSAAGGAAFRLSLVPEGPPPEPRGPASG
ncbi:MAG: HAMP domain-containing protein [Myxococcales bacterium]|nr:HAMP domain-containing protein [Myxococcales bacterium]